MMVHMLVLDVVDMVLNIMEMMVHMLVLDLVDMVLNNKLKRGGLFFSSSATLPTNMHVMLT